MNQSSFRSVPEFRGHWYLQVDKHHKTVKSVCATYGISRKTYYRWYKIDHGLNLPKRPRKMHPQTKIIGNVRTLIVETKLKYNYGPLKMSDWLKSNHQISVSHQAIYKFYKKKRLIRKPLKKLQWYTPLKEPYKAEIPGENVQIDVKYVPAINQTWEYQYRFIDCVSNLQYATNMLTKEAESTIAAFKQAKRYFPFNITGVQTDNGSEFRGGFHKHLVRHNIVHRYIPKRSAPWNGKVERANRSVDDEYYLNPTKPWKTILEYVNWFNFERPHLGRGMDGMTPHQKYLILATKSVTLEG